MKPVLCALLAALCLLAGEGLAAPKDGQKTPAPPPAPAPLTDPSPAERENTAGDLQDPELTFALTAGQAEKGDPAAMLRLGGLYEQGLAVPRNYGKAREWYEKAAAAGLAEGYYNTGLCYEIGMGAETDLAKAAANFEQAAALGLPPALYKLGLWHQDGTGVDKNTAKALEYLALAADGGHDFAANDLGVIYSKGALGQKQNLKLALNLFLQAAEKGNPEAMKNIAVLFKNGFNGKPNPVKALKWYAIARDCGYSSPDLTAVTDALRQGMTPEQIAAAETEAAAWLKRPLEQAPGVGQASETPN
jgi:TPR repeat protein